MKSKTRHSSKPTRSAQIPVTVEMMNEMEGRLSHKIDSGLQRVDSKMAELKSEIHGIKSEVFGVKSELHRVALMVEEQNARNKFVLDGYAQLYELIERKLG